VAALAAVPTSFFVAMVLTPVLWRLEGVTGVELAGHSGPSDWIIGAIFGLFTLVLSIILLRLTRVRATVIVPSVIAPDSPPTRGEG
jgi:hypothetical protein